MVFAKPTHTLPPLADPVVKSAFALNWKTLTKVAVAVFDVPGDDVELDEIAPVVLAEDVLPKLIPSPDHDLNLYPELAVATMLNETDADELVEEALSVWDVVPDAFTYTVPPPVAATFIVAKYVLALLPHALPTPSSSTTTIAA